MSDTIRVLIVEDSADDCQLVLDAMDRGGFQTRHERVETREAMQEALIREEWDIIISDFRMPHFSGLEALELVRELGIDIPFVLISGTIGEEIAVTAMKAGAHDYLMKNNLQRLGPVIKRELEETEVRRDRRIAEERLREGEERFRLIAENVADLIAVLELDGTRVYNSPSYGKILGDPELLRGTDSFREIHPDDREKVKSVFRQTVETGVGQRIEYRLLSNNGNVCHIESLGSVIRDKEGRPWRIVVVSRDVTDKKRLEEQIIQSQKMESVGTLAGGIAHDFNNILGIILGYISLLRRDTTDADTISKSSQAIEQAVQRGAGLVRQILTLARRSPVSLGPVNINGEIESLTTMLRQTFPKTIEIALDLDKSLPIINVDQTQFHQALLNLCVNARDAMMNGTSQKSSKALRILTTVVKGATLKGRFPEVLDLNYVRVVVSDDGMGMTEATKEKIFEPFFTTKEKGKGTGLGLAMVYGVVKTHNGFIRVESQPGRGSTFELYFPTATSLTPTIEDVPLDVSGVPTGNETILLVEDEESFRNLLKDSIEERGYKVICAADGIEAIRLYTEHKDRIDLILSDLGLPKLDGTALFSVFKTINPRIKVVFMTGYFESEEREELLNAGVEIIEKPFLIETVIRKMRAALDKQ